MRRVFYALLVVGGFVAASALWGCSSFDWDNTASGGGRVKFGVGTCRPYSYEQETEITPPNGVGR